MYVPVLSSIVTLSQSGEADMDRKGGLFELIVFLMMAGWATNRVTWRIAAEITITALF